MSRTYSIKTNALYKDGLTRSSSSHINLAKSNAFTQRIADALAEYDKDGDGTLDVHEVSWHCLDTSRGRMRV